MHQSTRHTSKLNPLVLPSQTAVLFAMIVFFPRSSPERRDSPLPICVTVR
jgi:hypothetical protein